MRLGFDLALAGHALLPWAQWLLLDDEEIETMNPDDPGLTNRKWTAAELRKLPPQERDAILEAAAALAEEEYRNNPELTAFEAFGKNDLYGYSSSTDTVSSVI